jgi:hypothetical protein
VEEDSQGVGPEIGGDLPLDGRVEPVEAVIAFSENGVVPELGGDFRPEGRGVAVRYPLGDEPVVGDLVGWCGDQFGQAPP